ncbi:hypothetical protein [Actinoplanes derwentensis]|uniref:Sugar lactone lactonase YvrE n=1 Tax=Actinoplanes derwentensis TaxID=113562 RepID=A0A1H1S8B9_9ACTN|nr:hypothetical protein [Actinoplanes derwentensis]GID83369.1 hypothetical protein Ade03nite_22930 [Actinoplanes derwentensis]SDS44202.1 hypothetical protein SAMN04489716_0793 [Actinoplanes derwentensis]
MTFRTLRGTAVAIAAGVLFAGPAQAASMPISKPTVTAHFDLTAGQTPENIALDRNGSVDVTFALSHQIARISATGRTTVLATLPAPADASAVAPVIGFSLVTGLVRDGNRFYVAYATGSKAETGIWTFTEDNRIPVKLADLPADGAPNGLTINPATGILYATDPVKGAVYSVPTRGRQRGYATVLSSAAVLRPVTYLGVNGAKVRGEHLYVTNLDKGTILRTTLTGRKAGTFETVATGLTGIDDFTFTGNGTQLLAAINPANKVVLVTPARGRAAKVTTVLTATDGLSNPTSVAVRGHQAYVTSAAYSTLNDPNLLTSRIANH